MATEKHERERLKAGYGEHEAAERDKTVCVPQTASSYFAFRLFYSRLRLIYVSKVRRTQRAIKHTLTERWYAWENARRLAINDPEVDLKANISQGEPAFIPDLLEVRIIHYLA